MTQHKLRLSSSSKKVGKQQGKRFGIEKWNELGVHGETNDNNNCNNSSNDGNGSNDNSNDDNGNDYNSRSKSRSNNLQKSATLRTFKCCQKLSFVVATLTTSTSSSPPTRRWLAFKKLFLVNSGQNSDDMGPQLRMIKLWQDTSKFSKFQKCTKTSL